jgi:hypothetical protein
MIDHHVSLRSLSIAQVCSAIDADHAALLGDTVITKVSARELGLSIKIRDQDSLLVSCYTEQALPLGDGISITVPLGKYGIDLVAPLAVVS